MASYESRVRVISETNLDSANNTSYVTVAYEFRRTDYSYYGYNRTGDAYWSIVCAGQGSGNQYFTFDWSIPQNVWHEIGRWSFTIPHNADGSKAVFMQALVYFGNGVAPGNLWASGDAVLTTIPRATAPTLSPATQTIGQNITINLPRASSSFTHSLSYSFGGLSGTIATGAGTSATFTLPESFIAQIPSAVTKTGKITCRTYNGSTLVGTKEVTFTARVPSDVVPSISGVTISEAEEEIAEKFGIYVRNKSRLHIVPAATGAQGSTISSCRVDCDGGIYTGMDVTTDRLGSEGTVQIKVTVTDSRGRTATTSRSITVYDYYNPNIRTFAAYRADSAGAEDDEAESAKLVIDFEIAPINNKNDKSYKVQTQKQGETSWTTILSGSVYSYDDTYVKTGTVLNADDSYTVRLVVSDYFMETVAEIEIGTAFTLMDFRYTGRGMAIGKVSQKDALEINMDVEFLKALKLLTDDETVDIGKMLSERITDRNELALVTQTGFLVDALAIKFLSDIQDYIVDFGSNNNGKYVKLSSGILIMWAGGSATCAIGSAAGSMYASSEFTITYPEESLTAAIPVFNTPAGGAIWGNVSGSANNFKTSFRYHLFSATVWNLASFFWSYIAIGTWK